MLCQNQHQVHIDVDSILSEDYCLPRLIFPGQTDNVDLVSVFVIGVDGEK